MKNTKQYNYNGELNGPFIKLYLNGIIDEIGHYFNGKPHGYWEEYFDNGKLILKMEPYHI